MDLNEIIENLCDWMRENKITVRRMGFYPKFGGVCLELNLVKKTNWGRIVIGHEFYVGEDVSSMSWNEDCNDLRLREMIEELKRRENDENQQSGAGGGAGPYCAEADAGDPGQ